jgi:predicted short-subunit dehydrogenase-like oxidoreductase (DUF2520 family)
VSERRPTLAIIGAGRVGRALGRRLRRRGWRIGAVVTRSQKTASAAARAIGAGRPHSRLDAGLLAADLVLITTPDRAISTVANALARHTVAQGARSRSWNGALRISSGRGHARQDEPLAGKIILHTNGALDRTVLAPLERLGAATGSLHPLQTFSGRAVPRLDGCICAIEGTPAALRVARRICRDLGCAPVVLAPASKPAYHAAGALAAGHILAVIESATRILVTLGFSRRDAVSALLPLTRQTLANFERLGPRPSSPHPAWTGPLSRGDFATVAKHVRALRRFPREYRDAYEALSRLAVLVLGQGGRR